MRTQVAIIGAGPTGLLLGHLLRQAGIDCVIIERRMPAYILGRIRAGVLETVTTGLMEKLGLADRMNAEGLREGGFNLADGIRGAPYHPQTQGKIERWHQTLKNRILLENYYLPGNLEAQIEAFIDHYNHRQYHESLDNLPPPAVYVGRGPAIFAQRARIKRQTIEHRSLQHRKLAA